MRKKIGVLLSGCGVFDGSEIHESVLTLLALSEHDVEVVCFAPDIAQRQVINHNDNSALQEKRSVLVESARIARGPVQPITKCSPNNLDALILPGGFGAALNLCDFAINGANATIDSGVATAIQAFHKAGKPLGALCIAPVVLALALKNKGVQLTIGNDSGVAQGIIALGNQHINCKVSEIVIDEHHKVVTTPAYMLAKNISEAWSGIHKLIEKIVAMS